MWLVFHPAVVSALTIIAAYGNLIPFNVIRAIPVYNISWSLLRVILMGQIVWGWELGCKKERE